MSHDTKRHKADELTEQQCKQKILELCEEERWEEALVWERRLVDAWHTELMMKPILKRVTLHADELRREGSGSSLFLLGRIYYSGSGGVARDLAAAYACFCEAAKLGHVFALFVKGVCLRDGYGTEQDDEVALRCFQAAGETEPPCLDACDFAAECFCDLGYRGTEKSLFWAAYWYSRGGGEVEARCIMEENPLEASCFGYWSPNREVQQFVLPAVRQAMVAWLLVAKRLPLSRHVINLVLPYICTRSGWPSYLTFEFEN